MKKNVKITPIFVVLMFHLPSKKLEKLFTILDIVGKEVDLFVVEQAK